MPSSINTETNGVLSVCLFGRFRLADPVRAITSLHQRRAQELFCYLLLNRNRPYSREALASLLWDDCDSLQARKHLRQALWQIQATLQQTGVVDLKTLLTLDAEWIQLNSVECLSLDVAQFEQALDSCKGVQNLSVTQVEGLEQAVQLYCGDLLEGCYQDWCLFERERLQNQYLSALDKIVDCCDVNCYLDKGLAYADRILRHDPADEQTHYHMMHLYWVTGRRTRAIRQYHRCKEILLKELGVQPSERTNSLFTKIQADEFPALQNENPQTSSTTSGRNLDRLQEVMTQFEQLQLELSAIEAQIKHDIQAVTATLRSHR